VNVGFRTAGVVTKKAFAYLDLVANGRFTSSGLDSGTVMTGATLFYSPFDRHSVVAHVGAGFLNDPRPGGEFDLGLGLGPRGFLNHAFTGDRALNTTAEYRYMAALDFLKGDGPGRGDVRGLGRGVVQRLEATNRLGHGHRASAGAKPCDRHRFVANRPGLSRQDRS
jgi:hypothetical protein